MLKTISQLSTTLVACLGIISCGGGGTPSNQQPAPTTPIPPPVEQPQEPDIIEDISCTSTYSVEIEDVYLEGNTQTLSALFDKNKLSTSTWQPQGLENNLIVELTQAAQIKQLVITWQDLENANMYSVYGGKSLDELTLLGSQTQSSANAIIPDVIELQQVDNNHITAKYLSIAMSGNAISQPSGIIEIEAYGCIENTNHDIELIDWYLSVPTDEDSNGRSDSISEQALFDGYFDPRFFIHSADGGLVFTTSVSGYKTSTNTKYVRSELREMLRRGNTSHSTQGVNKNNWVFSSAPLQDQQNAAAVDGVLSAELAVNHVTTTGEDYQIGRVIIGQIHANDDEPARLYYRKLPDNDKGAIYLAHELLGGDDTYYEIIGSRSNSADNPANGIGLNERFRYTIAVDGNELTVTIIKSDGSEYQAFVDMSASGYDVGGQYMYFKAGVYNQNNSGDQHDYVQATFYQIDNSHTGY